MATYLTKLGDWYYYSRRVPSHLKAYDKRNSIRIALKTKNHEEAIRNAAIHNDFIEKYWADLVRSGTSDENLERYKRAQQMARAHGFAYMNIAEVAELPLKEIATRVEALGDQPTKTQTEAMLGGPEAPQTKSSQCLELYWKLIDDRLVEKSDHQKRKYKEPRLRAFKDFSKIIGDKPIAQIERSDILKYKAWLMQRVSALEIAGNTANKQLSFVKDILRSVGRELEIVTDFDQLFAGTKFANKKKSRPPFETSYIRENFIQSEILNNLNDHARCLVMMMIETGARPMELIGLLPEEYHLDTETPYIEIKKNHIRSLKTDASIRNIPLVGVALQAAKQVCSTGLTRYQEKPDHASSTIGKFFRENNFKPTKEHTFYSFRHSFKDRLRDVEAPQEIIDELMGHSHRGPVYGRGRLLEQKYEWLKKMAFDSPPTGGV